MKQLIIPFVLSAGIHLLFFSMVPCSFNKKHFSGHKPSVISMTLVRMKTPVRQAPLLTRKNISTPVPIKKPEEKFVKVLKKKLLKKTVEKQEVSNKPAEKQEPLVEPEKKQKKLNKPSEVKALAGTFDSNSVLTDKNAHKETPQIVSKNMEKAGMHILKEAMPMYKTNPSPKYPGLARKRGYQGTVVLNVLVDQNGRVGDLRLFTSSGHSILDKNAMESVRKWLFEPGMRGDKKIEMWVRVPVRFELK